MGIRRWLSGTLRPDDVETDSITADSATVNGTIGTDALDAEKADVTNETAVYASLEANKSGLAAGEYHQVADTVLKDKLGEMSGLEFTPTEDGQYDVSVSVEVFATTDGDRLLLGVRNVDTNTVFAETLTRVKGSQDGESAVFNDLFLEAGTRYDIVAQDQDNTFSLGSAFSRTRFTIRKAFVQ